MRKEINKEKEELKVKEEIEMNDNKKEHCGIKGKLDKMKIINLEREVRFLNEDIEKWCQRAMALLDENIYLCHKTVEYLTMLPDCKYNIIKINDAQSDLIDKETKQVIAQGVGIVTIRRFLEEKLIEAKSTPTATDTETK